MNRKQFSFLLVAVVLVGAAGLIVHQRNRNSWQIAATTIGQKLLPNLAINDIAQITIQSGTNTLNLAQRDQLWRVRERGDYPADFSCISNLLLKLADLKIVQTEDAGPSQLGRFELLPSGAEKNSGTLVGFKDQSGKTLDTLLLGKKHQSKPAANSPFGGSGGEGWPDGRYVMAGASAKTVAVISDPLDNVQPQPEQWLNKEFFSIEKPRLIEVKFPEATNSWELTRASETNEWQLAEAKPGEKLDTSKMYGVTSPFSSPSFNSVAPLKSGNSTNETVLTVETFDGFTYVAKIAPKQNETFPVCFTITASLPAERAVAKDEKAEDKAKLDKEFKDRQTRLTEKLAKEKQFEKWVYYLPGYAVDPILKSRGQLLEEVKKPAPTQPEK